VLAVQRQGGGRSGGRQDCDGGSGGGSGSGGLQNVTPGGGSYRTVLTQACAWCNGWARLVWAGLGVGLGGCWMGGWRAHTAASGAAAASMQPWRPRGKGHGLRVNAHRCVPFGHVGGQRGEGVVGCVGGRGHARQDACSPQLPCALSSPWPRHCHRACLRPWRRRRRG
jgi:hypothetical protein